MGDTINASLAEALKNQPGIVDVTTATGTRAGTDAVDWVGGEPGSGSYSMLIVLDASYARDDPREEAATVRNHVKSSIPEEYEGFTLVELMGHGRYTKGPQEGRPVVAVLVES